MKGKTDRARELIYNLMILIRRRSKNSLSLSSLNIKCISSRIITYRKPTIKTLIPL